MRELRHVPFEGAVDLRLAEGVVEVVVAADHMGDAHVVVVDNDRQIVGRRAVGAQNDQIVQFRILYRDLALHEVVDRRRAFLWRLQANDRRNARRRFRRIAIAPGTLDVYRALLGPRLGAHRLEFFRRAVTVIGPALREHLARDLGMARGTGELMDDVTIPVEPEPGEPIDDRGHRLGGRAHPVRILDAQPECAALAIALVVARIEPVEQRGAGAADMEKPGRGGGETDDDTHAALCKPCWRAAKSLSRTAGEGA